MGCFSYKNHIRNHFKTQPHVSTVLSNDNHSEQDGTSGQPAHSGPGLIQSVPKIKIGEYGISNLFHWF